MTQDITDQLRLPDGSFLTYHKIRGRSPTILFLHGFRSDRHGVKTTHLAEFCRQTGRAFVAFDHFGHGDSSGTFIEGTISRWRQDAQHICDALVEDTALVVGSSMGGWVSVLLALDRPQKIMGMVGLASAPDFTQRLIEPNLSNDQIQQLQDQGKCYLPSLYGDPYPVTKALLEDARQNLVLSNALPLHIPLHLIHGTQDSDVPWEESFCLLQKAHTQNARLTLIKGGDHRLSRQEDLVALCAVVEQMTV